MIYEFESNEMMNGLKQKRVKRNMTQWDMARKLGVSLGTYRLWEAGISKPNKENQKRLDELLKGEDKEE